MMIARILLALLLNERPRRKRRGILKQRELLS
jgi:hypothetical protein